MPKKTDETDKLFPLIGKFDRPFVEEIVKGVRTCFRRPDITASQMHHLAVLLFGLERLPLATPGINVTFTLSYQTKGGMNCHSIDLDESTFSLSTGGYVYDSEIGSDSISDEVLMVEVGGFREVKWRQFDEWLGGFQSRLEDNEIKIDLDDPCEVDWSGEADESAWEKAVKEYDSEDEPEN